MGTEGVRGLSPETAEQIFKRIENEDPAWAAYERIEYCGLSIKDAEKIIESTGLGDPAWIAQCMVKRYGSSQEWADKVASNFEKRTRLLAKHVCCICGCSSKSLVCSDCNQKWANGKLNACLICGRPSMKWVCPQCRAMFGFGIIFLVISLLSLIISLLVGL